MFFAAENCHGDAVTKTLYAVLIVDYRFLIRLLVFKSETDTICALNHCSYLLSVDLSRSGGHIHNMIFMPMLGSDPTSETGSYCQHDEGNVFHAKEDVPEVAPLGTF